MRLRGFATAPLIAALAFATSAHAEEHHAEHQSDPTLLIFHVFGLLLLLGVIIYYARVPLQAFLRDRSDGLRRQLDAARAALERAEAASREANARLARMADENEALVRASAEQAEGEKLRAIERARAAAERVREEARRSADQEIERARTVLQTEAARLATQLAGEIVRRNLTAQDEDRLVADFVERAGRAS